jgi:hypothetical protein
MRILGLLIASVLGVGCYATASPGYYGPSVGVTATTVGPDLVYVSPGVQVIADYGEPVFYSDGFYWRESGGIWYRSSYHTHGWVSYAAPRHIYGIRDRHTYRNYRPAGYTPRSYRNDSRSYRNDSRSYRNDNRPAARSYGNNRPDSRVNTNNHNAPTTQKRSTENRPAPRKSSDKDKRK